MPTFESINFSRELATRLVIVSSSSSENYKNINHDNDSAKNTFTLVETPQALLSRHPLSLRLKNDNSTTGATTVSTNPLHCNGFPELRQEVAHKLIALSLPGQRNAKMRDTLLQDHHHHHHHQRQHDEEVDRGSGSLAYDHRGLAADSMSIPGTISVLDMLKYQRVIATSRTCTNPTMPSLPNANENTAPQHPATSMPVLSTGSIRLDTLLGIVIPNTNGNQQEEILSMPLLMVASCCGSPSPSLSRSNNNQSLSWNNPMPVQGLARGFVVQCSGPTATGKTQLALSLAASASFQQLGVLYLGSALGQGSLRPLVLRFRQLLVGMIQQQPHQLHHFQQQQQQQQQQQLIMACMERVSFQVVHDGFELLACLAELEETLLLLLSQQPQSASNCPRVVILDAASGCLNTEDETLLQRISLRIKHLARHYHLVVWINNASLMPTTTTTFNQKSNPPKQRSSIDGTHYYPVDLQQQQQQLNHNNSPNHLVKPKVALGQAWRKVFDVHISLQRCSSPSPQPHAPRQASQGNPNNQKQQPPVSTTIRASLEAHPFKKCHTNSLEKSHDAESMMRTADFCITAKGIQDRDDDDDDRHYHYASKSAMPVSAGEQTE